MESSRYSLAIQFEPMSSSASSVLVFVIFAADIFSSNLPRKVIEGGHNSHCKIIFVNAAWGLCVCEKDDKTFQVAKKAPPHHHTYTVPMPHDRTAHGKSIPSLMGDLRFSPVLQSAA